MRVRIRRFLRAAPSATPPRGQFLRRRIHLSSDAFPCPGRLRPAQPVRFHAATRPPALAGTIFPDTSLTELILMSPRGTRVVMAKGASGIVRGLNQEADHPV